MISPPLSLWSSGNADLTPRVGAVLRMAISLATVQHRHMLQLHGSPLELQKCVSFLLDLKAKGVSLPGDSTWGVKPVQKKAEGKEGLRELNSGDIVEPL